MGSLGLVFFSYGRSAFHDLWEVCLRLFRCKLLKHLLEFCCWVLLKPWAGVFSAQVLHWRHAVGSEWADNLECVVGLNSSSNWSLSSPSCSVYMQLLQVDLMGITIKSLADIEKEVRKWSFLRFKNILCQLWLFMYQWLPVCESLANTSTLIDSKQKISYVTRFIVSEHAVTTNNPWTFPHYKWVTAGILQI